MQDKHKHKYKNENEESPYVFLLNSEIQMTISEMHDASERSTRTTSSTTPSS